MGRAFPLWFFSLLSVQEKESELCYFPTSSTSCTPLNLCNAPGSLWFAHLFLLRGPGRCLEKGEIQEDSERSKEDIFLLLCFPDRSFFPQLSVCVTALGVVLYLRVFSLGCVSAQQP